MLSGQSTYTTQCIITHQSTPANPASTTRRNFSSTWVTAKPTDFDKMTPIDREKALFHIKRKMGASYSKGWLLISGRIRRWIQSFTNIIAFCTNDDSACTDSVQFSSSWINLKYILNVRFFNLPGLYGAALDDALELEEKVKRTMGKDNAIYASCLNNIALMNKMVGLLNVLHRRFFELMTLQLFRTLSSMQLLSVLKLLSRYLSSDVLRTSQLLIIIYLLRILINPMTDLSRNSLVIRMKRWKTIWQHCISTKT